MEINQTVCLLEQPDLRDPQAIRELFDQESFGNIIHKNIFRGQSYYYLFCNTCRFSHIFPGLPRKDGEEKLIADHKITSKHLTYTVRMILMQRVYAKSLFYKQLNYENIAAFRSGVTNSIRTLQSNIISQSSASLLSSMPDVETRAMQWLSTQLENDFPQDYFDLFWTNDGISHSFEIQIQREDQYQFKNGIIAKYGLCRTNLEKEIWYLTIGNETYFIEKACLDRDFLEKMGSDGKRWQQISYDCHIGFNPFDGANINSDVKIDLFRVLRSDDEHKKQTLLGKLFN